MSHAALSNEQSSQLQALYEEMRPAGLTPLWEVLAALVTPEPTSPVVAHRWRFDEARGYLMRAGDLISAAQAERRVLILETPACPEPRASPTACTRGCS